MMIRTNQKQRKTAPWGDTLAKINPETTCRRFFQNANGIREYGNDPKTTTATKQ